MIPYGKHYIDEDDIGAVVEVLRHGLITQGPKIEEFENAIADYVGARYAVAVSSGTAALHIACLAGGVGPGDAVITSPNTFVASANCAVYVGAQPVLSDIDAASLNLSPDQLRDTCARHDNARCVIPVHYAGSPCDMETIAAIARDHDLLTIEDASHALGASYPDGGRVGSCRNSDMTIFSFHPVKMIASGEGGMITTNDAELYRKLLRLRSHGINKLDDQFQNAELSQTDGKPNPWYYEMQQIGFNYRITDLQCALALSQLSKLDSFLEARRSNAMRYDAAFRAHPILRPTQLDHRGSSSHHLYVLKIDFNRLGKSRSEVITELKAQGVGTQVHYIPVHFQPYYAQFGFRLGDFPIAESFYDEALSIPQYFSLTTGEQDFVIEQILRACS